MVIISNNFCAKFGSIRHYRMLVLILLTTVVVLTFISTTKSMIYWKKRNVKTTKIIPFFGENLWLVLGLEGFSNQLDRIYHSFSNERYFGFYQFTRPILFLKEPDLIKDVCVKQFDHFMNRPTIIPDIEDGFFSKFLISLKGQKWRDARSTLSPVFTSSKMKAMYNLVSQKADQFVDYFKNQEKPVVEVEFKDAMSRFSNDAIASTVYGVQIDSLIDKENEFHKMGCLGTNFAGFKIKLALLMHQFAPKVSDFLGIKFFDEKVQYYFVNLVKDIIELRKSQNIKRNDVIGLLLDSQENGLNGGYKKDEEVENRGSSMNKKGMEMKKTTQNLGVEDIAAQTFLFFIAGFEGVANLLCHTAHELALHPDIQKKLIDEVDQNRSEISYNTIMNMEYLDMVITEALRKWPFAMTTDRTVTKKYTIQPIRPGEEPVTLEPGMSLMISIISMQRDPKYFENPDEFDPERFSPENRKKIVPYTYIPFGIGPRNCIGNRFTLMEVKTLLFKIMCHFEIVPTHKTQIPLKMNKNSLTPIPIDGFHLGLKRRQHFLTERSLS